jgi:hypothetical protein
MGRPNPLVLALHVLPLALCLSSHASARSSVATTVQMIASVMLLVISGRRNVRSRASTIAPRTDPKRSMRAAWLTVMIPSVAPVLITTAKRSFSRRQPHIDPIFGSACMGGWHTGGCAHVDKWGRCLSAPQTTIRANARRHRHIHLGQLFFL